MKKKLFKCTKLRLWVYEGNLLRDHHSNANRSSKINLLQYLCLNGLSLNSHELLSRGVARREFLGSKTLTSWKISLIC